MKGKTKMVDRISAPTPSVVHLVTLFRQITNGEIKIPAFQRDYVWSEKQIISLLDSVYESFPIGSLLFWRVEQKALEVAPRKLTAFPATAEEYPLSYVLDGMQRLTTLYGVFHFEADVTNPILNVGFELRQKKFRSLDQRSKTTDIFVPLASLFSPKKLLEFQSRIAKEADGDELLNSVLTLQAAFQDYMIPTVTIQSGDIDRVVGIFERVNSTGTRLNSVDFMRAITWTSSFDLSNKISEVTAELAEFEWALREDTIIKCVAIVLEMDVSSESLLELRNVDENALHDAFNQVVPTLKKTSEFLKNAFNIVSPDVVSYEGQLLVSFLLCHMGIAENVRTDFIRWFWACGLNEQLRGKPDDFVVNLLSDWKAAETSNVYEGRIQPSFTPRDFLTRRLLARAALTNTFKMLFAQKGAKDMQTGNEIPPHEYLSSSSTDHLLPILSRTELANLGELVGDKVASAKLFCNTVLIQSDLDVRTISPRDEVLRLLAEDKLDVLESQFITKEAAEALLGDDLTGFLTARATEMSAFSESLLQ